MVPMADLTTALLRGAWGALGGAADRPELVEVKGDGAGLLHSTLPVLPAMVAAVATSTLAASVLTGAPVRERPRAGGHRRRSRRRGRPKRAPCA
jgi:hypothetical protein